MRHQILSIRYCSDEILLNRQEAKSVAEREDATFGQPVAVPLRILHVDQEQSSPVAVLLYGHADDRPLFHPLV